MVTFLVLIVVIPTLTILTRLENRRSRRKVSIDGFKMINGRIVSAEELKIAMLVPPLMPIPPPRYGGIETRDRDADREAS